MHPKPWIGLLVGLTALALAAPAQAAFPGANGKIAFEVTGSADMAGIYTVNPDGTGKTRLTLGVMPAWSPDGTKIVFSRNLPFTGNDDLFVMNADGTGQTNITNSPATSEFEPGWSPDGTKIVFQRNCDIYVMNVDGSGERSLTSDGCGIQTTAPQDFHPKWSPDGTKISFESYRGIPGCGSSALFPPCALDIFVMNADGSNPVNLTNSTGADYEADWSPDSAKVVFRSDRDGGARPGEIYVMDANGQNQTRLTDTPSAYETATVWSPDGTKIAFLRDDPVSDPVNQGDLYFMNADGSGVTKILDGVAPTNIDWGPLVTSPPPPPPSDEFKNASKRCEAEREADESAFQERYRNHGGCVSQYARSKP